ncbi:MAG: glucosidase [Anaerolineae bacterium]|nr:glucosidase [Anaerolineae bacterium]
MQLSETAEYQRLYDDSGARAWLHWGPYLSERAWGTVREDYSADGNAWSYLPHDHARSRAYRWNEDGLGGICDEHQHLCFALALWNGRDAILKERLFGLTGPEGNHGEDVKEYYYYLDSTPTHSYMQMLYKYPQAAFPYTQLIVENQRRSKDVTEFELLDTGIFDEDRYFDVFIEYAKVAPDDTLIQIRAINRGATTSALHLLPTLWFRNTWSWGRDNTDPHLHIANDENIQAHHPSLGSYSLYCAAPDELLFAENNTNTQRLYGVASSPPYFKDAFHEYIINGHRDAVNPLQKGTKAAAHFYREIAAGETAVFRLRLRKGVHIDEVSLSPFANFDQLFAERRREADEFYAALQPANLSDDLRNIQRQAFAGLLWTKQFYHYDVQQWLEGDPAQPPPPPQRKNGRNREWTHVNNADILSMPDAWEYPWFAAWDLAFHCIPLALIDVEFAKSQLILLLREWYQHPNGQIPAYEWSFSDVNPPVFAWAALRIYQLDQEYYGNKDTLFLERVFHKLLLNFTWWVNRKDSEGKNIFQGGFLGLDNIGVFDRSAPLPQGGHIEQSDGTSWMAMFCLNMMAIALELARTDVAYEDIATKFFEHYMYIAGAMNNIGGDGIALWDETDEFFYDVLNKPDSTRIPLRIRSLIGLIPLLAVEVVEPELLNQLPDFKARLEWFLANRPELAGLTSRWKVAGEGERHLFAVTRGHRMKRLLKRALDSDEFLSDYGIRSISKYHLTHPYVLHIDNNDYVVNYEPAESRSGLFGGNSNWRGPVWFPINYLLIESLHKFQNYYSDDFLVECPTASGQHVSLSAIANELSTRLIRLFERDDQGRRAIFGSTERFQRDPHWRDYLLFYEYFHGDNGAGLGASHQTGWTGLIATLIQHQVTAKPK